MQSSTKTPRMLQSDGRPGRFDAALGWFRRGRIASARAGSRYEGEHGLQRYPGLSRSGSRNGGEDALRGLVWRRPAKMTPLRIVLAAAFALALEPAIAQNAPPVASARATIESVSADGANLGVRTRAGE